MGGASRLWSSWNLRSQAGNVLVKLGRVDVGGSGSSGRERWISP